MCCIMFTMFTMNSCATVTPLVKSKKYPLPKDGIRVVKDKIYHNDTLFAELRYFDGSFEEGEQGLVIYYYPPYDKEVWIHPKGGLRVEKGKYADTEAERERKVYTKLEDMNLIIAKYDHEHLAYTKGLGTDPDYWVHIYPIGKSTMGKFEYIFAGSKVVRISPDGKFVYYRTAGLFGWSWLYKKYLVEYGE